jgi:hypothetical protein
MPAPGDAVLGVLCDVDHFPSPFQVAHHSYTISQWKETNYLHRLDGGL